MTMTVAWLVTGVLLQAPPPPAPASMPGPDAQIAAAVLAAPEESRTGAAVLGYDQQGAVVRLREGTNGFICLADDPRAPGFSVACYHQDLEPYMARGRTLRAEGVTNQRAINEMRWKEVEAGKLKVPREPRTLHVLSGKGYDPTTGTVTDRHLRWVIYVPFATAEATGLATRPVENGPWLMDPGTPGAHIMITPPRPKP